MAAGYLELRENNPYSYGTLFNFDEGDSLLEMDDLVFKKTEADRYFTVEYGDDLWSIAAEAYGNSKWYWVLWFANNLDNPYDILIGSTLYVPDLETFKTLQNG